LPVIITMNITTETSSAFLRFMVFTNWGINEDEVQIPATKPSISMNCI
jgi:hypothetical protein